MILLSLTSGINGFVSAGYSINHIDIAPNYAGTLLGITNMSANTMGIVAPYFTGFLITGHVRII